MGLSIHYSGKLKDKAVLPRLIEEVKDVCTILGWPWHINEEKVKGISFTPPDCETVGLNFLSNGEVISRSKLLYNIHPATTVSVKTQYAGPEVHIALIKLLKHFAKQYFAVFKLSDESHYWETGNEDVLRKYFGTYNQLLDFAHSALKDFKTEEGDTPERLADRLENFLNER